MKTSENFLRERGYNLFATSPFIEMLDEFAKLSIIEELRKYIEHPTKPGYKRHDIINRIEELENK